MKTPPARRATQKDNDECVKLCDYGYHGVITHKLACPVLLKRGTPEWRRKAQAYLKSVK